jgi:hypothetical protein
MISYSGRWSLTLSAEAKNLGHGKTKRFGHEGGEGSSQGLRSGQGW